MPLTVRPTLPQDEQFLYQLVYQTMSEQLFAWTWDPNIREQLLDLQIRAKHGSYAAEYPHANHGIIVWDNEPVGRLIVDRSGEFHVLVDIAILPKYRSAGIGTRIILGLCMEADLVKKKLRLQVSITNPRKLLGLPV